MASKRRVTKPARLGEKKLRKETKVPERKVRVSEKDPLRMCGKDTSVERLFRVEEQNAKTKVVHLVFFDRHGWYCEHGRACPAVTDVRRFIKNGR